MADQKYFYITTTLPYVNAKPHMGHALEFVHADILARYHRSILGQEVAFNTGTDEHGQKIYQKAQEADKDPQVYVDEYAGVFKDVLKKLNISNTHFVRTTDAHHKMAAQEFWKRCEKNGDIYKKDYKIKYCVGCELEKTESELNESGHCLIHPHLDIELREEENYFFRFSKYQQPLLDFYEAHPNFVVPDFRYNEIKSFVKQGLQDFSISRVKEKLPWGVPVPGDEAQVMYVWFDALINYISTLGWPEGKSEMEAGKFEIGNLKLEIDFNQFWGTLEKPNGIQIAGKDNLRQQSAMWQAMLMSAGLPNSKQIIIHGFINAAGGQKMSKSLGNVIDPLEIVDQYGVDALRYWFAREMSTFEDGEFDMEKFKEAYNAGLANGIGNLTSRILKMAVNAGIKIQDTRYKIQNQSDSIEQKNYLETYEIQKAADAVWKQIAECDGFIQKNEPFKTIKTNPEQGQKDITYLLGQLHSIATSLIPFLPEASEKILFALENISQENIPRLFARLE